MGHILHNGLSTNSDHYIAMVKVGEMWYECVNVISLELSLTFL